MLAWLLGRELEQPEVVSEGSLEEAVVEAEADEAAATKAALVEAELKLQVVEAKLASDMLTDEKRARLEAKRGRLRLKVGGGNSNNNPSLRLAAGDGDGGSGASTERKPFPECLAVGAHVSVRDASDDVWEEGVVEGFDASLGPRVRKLTYDGAYYWDFIRPLGSAAELKRWSHYEKQRKRKARAVRREASLGTLEQRAAWRVASGDYPAAELAMQLALSWQPLEESAATAEGGCADVASLLAAWPAATSLLEAEVRQILEAITCSGGQSGSGTGSGTAGAGCEGLVRAAFAVYEVDGDVDDLCDSLRRVANLIASSQGAEDWAGSDDWGDLDGSAGNSSSDDDADDALFKADRQRKGSSDSGDGSNNESDSDDLDSSSSEVDSNMSEDDDSDDDAKSEQAASDEEDEHGDGAADDDDASQASAASSIASQTSSAAASPSFRFSVNAHPETLVFHEVVSLVKEHLNLDVALSPTECVAVAQDVLGLDFPPNATLRQKLNLALLQLRSADDSD